MNARVMAAAVVLAFGAAIASAQTPPPQTPPVQAPAAAPAAAFPEGAQMGFVFVQRLADETIEGRAAKGKVQAFQQEKLKSLGEKNKALEAAQGRLSAPGATDDQRASAQREIDRIQVDLQRTQQDAQAELDEFRARVNGEFERKLVPVVQQLVAERKVFLLMSREATGLLWIDPALDLTAEVVKRLDAASTPPAPPKPPGRP